MAGGLAGYSLQELLPLLLAGGIALTGLLVVFAFVGDTGVPARTMKRRLARVGRDRLLPGASRRAGVRRLDPGGGFPTLERMIRALLPRPR